jgi:integral membrane protein
MEPVSTGALTRFRVMAVISGVNLILLMFGFMPAKYLLDVLETNKWLIAIPIVHGYFYIAYILTALQIGVQTKMSMRNLLILILAGTIPFASFIAERQMVKKFGAAN